MSIASRNLAVMVCLACVACAHNQIPVEVQKFVERRDACDHFRGEVPAAGDPKRMNEVNDMLLKYCKGTDAELATLRARYYANGAATEKLSPYETRIEPKN